LNFFCYEKTVSVFLMQSRLLGCQVIWQSDCEQAPKSNCKSKVRNHFHRKCRHISKLPTEAERTCQRSLRSESPATSRAASKPKRTAGTPSFLMSLLPSNHVDQIIRLILQFLDSHNLLLSKTTLQDEANLNWHENAELTADLRRLSRAVEKGEWDGVDKMLGKKDSKIIWNCWKQLFLEYADSHDSRALGILQKRLKPMEHLHPDEFRDLAYVLTCRNVKDVPRFASWDKSASRMELTRSLQQPMQDSSHDHLPPNRLETLLNQALLYQVSRAKHPPSHSVSSLMRDWTPKVVPDVLNLEYRGHTDNIKAVAWINDTAISGGSDGTVRIWPRQTKEQAISLSSRVWNLDTTPDSILAACASGSVHLLKQSIGGEWQKSLALQHSDSDIYACRFHPAQRWIATGGYDKEIKIWDLETCRLIQTLSGHDLAVSSLVFHPMGNLLVSGGKDSSLKFWDLNSATCIRTWSSHLGPVTSVDCNSSGSFILTASKDNSNRLWDVRQSRPIQKYRGHQNTSKNLVRARIVSDDYIVSGSEDGKVYWWDMTSAKILRVLGKMDGTVYDVQMNAFGELISGGEDGVVRMYTE
jgi:COMPASS component SWD3